MRVPVFEDHRGSFSESWSRRKFAAAGITEDFVQDNHSVSREPWTLRGLHYQRPPCAQAKLVRVSRGAIWDVAVDLRRTSATFGLWAAEELSAANGLQLFIPAGFAHGYLTLQPETEVDYRVSADHSPEHEAGVNWKDPALGLPWPLGGRTPILSARDAALPDLAHCEPFP